jgi:hypothetical protein
MPGSDRHHAWKGADQAWSVTGTLLAGILVWGGVGKLLDAWLGLEALFTPIGMLLGMFTSIWVVYLRYGRVHD